MERFGQEPDDFNRPQVGDMAQERWMSSTNWAGDDEIKTAPEAKFESTPRKKNQAIRIFIDAGHGGKDDGAQGFGVSEASLSLLLTKRVQHLLLLASKYRNAPMEIMLSRSGDETLTLRDRYRAANTWEADVFVSVHANASPSPKTNGFEVYFLSTEATDETTQRLVSKENGGETRKESMVTQILADTKNAFHIRESSGFAESVFNAMSRTIRPNVRAVRQGPFTVLAGTDMPAVLIEVGYLTHPVESKLLTKETYLNRLAGAISSGIIEYFVDTKRLTIPNSMRVSKRTRSK